MTIQTKSVVVAEYCLLLLKEVLVVEMVRCCRRILEGELFKQEILSCTFLLYVLSDSEWKRTMHLNATFQIKNRACFPVLQKKKKKIGNLAFKNLGCIDSNMVKLLHSWNFNLFIFAPSFCPLRAWLNKLPLIDKNNSIQQWRDYLRQGASN